MNLDYVRSEFARMRAQIRRQQNQIEMLSRAYFNAGRIQEIADYCKSDVVNTYRRNRYVYARNCVNLERPSAAFRTKLKSYCWLRC
jgi:Predicted 3'-5' exonuclease related to the exonuclease domain of PolB